MNIVIKKLTSDQIPELNNTTSLYLADCSKIVDHHNFRSYENLAPWVITKGITLVNEDVPLIKYPNIISAILAPSAEDERTCIIDRFDFHQKVPADIYQLYTFIPHPSIDAFATMHNLSLNYSYADFLKLNNKVAQKELFKVGTPSWYRVTQKDVIDIKDKQNFFLKRDQGAGGEYVLRLDLVSLETLDFENYVWFVEKIVTGRPHSIQCFKNKENYVIFGFCEEFMENTSEYVGCTIIPLEELEKRHTFLDFVEKTVRIFDPFLGGFQGFFGFDFMCDWTNEAYNFLEANIRFTSSTIPVLVNNKLNDGKKAIFKEM